MAQIIPFPFHKIKNKSMIEHVILNAKNLNPNQIVVVVGYKNEMVEKHLENENF